jgi:aspartyl-tRNA(Asn)/glutamyl-tRNA(Gln) amidotransferase subunit C
MNIDTEEVKKLARLSRIDVTDDEAKKLGDDMTSILGYIDQIKDVDFDLSEESLTGPYNVLREDENPHESGIHKDVLVKSAPDNDGEYVKVKNIL